MFGLQMIQEIDTLQREMEQVLRGLGLNPEMEDQRRGSAFSFKLGETEEALQVEATLPGIDIEKLDISILGRQLTLSGEFAGVEQSDGIRWHRRERQSGRFEKSLLLPARVDADQVEAEYRQGILSIKLPKAASELPKRISVKANS